MAGINQGESERNPVSLWLIGLLWLLVVISALGVVYVTHVQRMRFNELQALKRQENELQVEWGQLLLEQSAWSTPSRVERIANKQLGLVSPDPAKINLVKE